MAGRVQRAGVKTRALLTTDDIEAIRGELKKRDPAWEKAFAAEELQAMADDAVEGCADGCDRDALRRCVLRTAAQVAAEMGLGEEGA